MCGIAGIVDRETNVDPTAIGYMIATIRHRGPDDQGIWTSQGVGLGNCRLAILDLSPAGHMPMSDSDGRLWITYNGEIYNYLELRQELETKGYQFCSHSDTEVVLYSYKEWGSECLRRFNGMWAFAIWDERERTLFGARDRFGVKPFYFFKDQRRFVFASEIKAIWTVVQASRRPNEAMVFSFLADRMIDHLSPHTLFSDISEVPPAHWFELRDGNLAFGRYWQIPEVPLKDKLPFSQRTIETFAALLEDAVRLRLRADVPVGTLLSGGLDSSSVTCLAYQLLGGNQGCESLHSFSALYPGAFDESRYVEEVTSGTNIVVHRAEPSASELVSVLDAMLWYQEAPFADASFFAQYCLMRLARQFGIKVVMSGQGADETLVGYPTSLYAYCGGLLASGNWGKLLGIWSGANDPMLFLVTNTFKHALPTSWKNGLRRHRQLHSLNWVDRGLVEQYAGHWILEDSRPPLDHHLLQYLTRYSLPTLLHHEDRNSMAFSIETRQPFLDYRLVEFVFSTTDDAKVDRGTTKAILRRAMQGIVPDVIRNRGDKIAFHAPVDEFLLYCRELVEDVLQSPAVQANPYLCSEGVWDAARLFFDQQKGSFVPVWRPFIFALWYAMFV